MKLWLVAVAAGVMLPLVGSTGAHAGDGSDSHSAAGPWTDSRSTFGAAATCRMSTSDFKGQRNRFASISCTIKDTNKTDKDSVYVLWRQDGFGSVRLNGVRNGTVNRSDTRFNRDAGFENLYWKVCRDIFLFPDNCSGTVKHRTS
jgi:hypothetical protein